MNEFLCLDVEDLVRYLRTRLKTSDFFIEKSLSIGCNVINETVLSLLKIENNCFQNVTDWSIKPDFHISRKDRKFLFADMFFKLSRYGLVSKELQWSQLSIFRKKYL